MENVVFNMTYRIVHAFIFQKRLRQIYNMEIVRVVVKKILDYLFIYFAQGINPELVHDHMMHTRISNVQFIIKYIINNN
jgi:hypothetical protein